MSTKVKQRFDVTKPDILSQLFSRPQITIAIKRIRDLRDQENLVTHPIGRIILTEYEDYLATLVSSQVAGEQWSPRRAYVCPTRKPSGGYRQLAFPCLVDSIVGRRAIDALEPAITGDDNDRTFCGRSHANTTRDPGDYERWFAVWQDYTSAIAEAAERSGYTYIFETDVSEFFPTIDRNRAKQALAKRTQAHSSLIELVFFCLESWLPRIGYSISSGIPIENNDVSRLVAHSFLKSIDDQFVDKEGSIYLRFADDTVVLVRSRYDAENVRRRHYMALSEVGLSPNLAKTAILTVSRFQETRHPEINREIAGLFSNFAEADFSALVARWYRRDRYKTPSWGQVTKRLYTLSRQKRSSRLRRRALTDVQETPTLAEHAFRYLRGFELTLAETTTLLKVWKQPETSASLLIELVKFLCDARFNFDASQLLADFAVGRIQQPDSRSGSEYARALLLILLHKHGLRSHRDRVRKWGGIEELGDEQIRLHFVYVFRCTRELDHDSLNAIRPLSSSDLELTLRLCSDIERGKVTDVKRLLARCIRSFDRIRTIEARYLPLIRLAASSSSLQPRVEEWIAQVLSQRAEQKRVRDRVVRRFLKETRGRITA